MKKLFRISLSVLFFALAFFVTQIPTEPVLADSASVSKDTDFQLNGTTLVKYTGTAKTVSVPASVEIIGDEAFTDHTEIEEILFKGNKVEKIGYRSFAGCNTLEKIKLPDSLISIGNGAFSDCSALKKVEVGDALKDIGLAAFGNCNALSSIVVPKTSKYLTVDDSCLYDKEKNTLYLVLPGREQKTYTMPSSVTTISPYAFWNCSKLEGISLNGNINEIPDYAFSNCKALKGIVIPFSVTSIGIKAFSDCVNLETADIPASVSDIHETAFDGCSKLEIKADLGTKAYEYSQTLKGKNQAEYEDTTANKSVWDLIAEKFTKTNTQSTNPQDANSQNTNQQANSTNTNQDNYDISDENLLASTHVVGNQAFIFIDNTKQTVLGTVNRDNMSSEDNFDALENSGLTKGLDIPKFTIAFDSIVADQAFYRYRNISQYEFPGDITQIGEFAFARSNLSTIDIPMGTKMIDYGAFYHCDYLRDVHIPSSVTYIAPKAFEKSMWMRNWLAGTGSDDYLVVGDGILLAYRGSGGDITIPDTVKRIGSEAFLDNYTITSVFIPSSVIEIGEDAFCNCRNLNKVIGADNVKIIRDRAFSGCIIDTAHIGLNVDHIGLKAFDFSETNASESLKVVVFDNKDVLPKACYEVTAERLSNDSARGYILGDTNFAIVDQHIKLNDLTGTVLDVNSPGMNGVVAYISSRDKAEVTCLAACMSEEEFQNIYIPEYINIDGKTYHVIGKENVTTFRQKMPIEEPSINVYNESNILTYVGDVSLEGNNKALSLIVSDSLDAYDEINRAYEEVYREALPQNIACVQISLVDENVNIPITKTGKQELSMAVKVPETVAAGSVRILTVDRNGQLENIAYTRDGDTLHFSVNHLSPFAFVNVSGASSKIYGEAAVSGTQAVIGNINKLDESPDTGDHIHPKWFLALGLTCIAIAILFIRKRPKENKVK